MLLWSSTDGAGAVAWRLPGTLPPVIPAPVVRVLALLFALLWLFPGFGLIDLTVTWDEDWPVVLEAGWGLFFTVVVAVPSLAVAAQLRRAAASIVQLTVGAAALVVGGLVSVELGAVVLGVLVALEAALFAAVRDGERVRPVRLATDRTLLLLAAVAAVPWLVYAIEMAELDRDGSAESDITNGVDHYAVQAATALALVALVLVAAVWPRARRLCGLSAASVAVYLGVVSFSSPGTPGGFDRTWSGACVLWGAAVAVAAWRGGRSDEQRGPRSETAERQAVTSRVAP